MLEGCRTAEFCVGGMLIDLQTTLDNRAAAIKELAGAAAAYAIADVELVGSSVGEFETRAVGRSAAILGLHSHGP
jgi:hypothetical protein